MPLCHLCTARAASVDAHAIPRSFFLKYKRPNEILRLAGTSRHFFPKKSPIGVYDSGILCNECEPKFSPYDDYGFEFFFPTCELETIYPGMDAEAFIVRSFDYRLLKLFILGTLWRASVSTQMFYAGVRLGRYEEKIRHLFLSGDPGGQEVFPVVIRRFSYPPKLIPVLCPVQMRIAGVHCYQLLLNGFLVTVKVDRQPLPPPLNEMALAPDKPLVILAEDYKSSIEHRAMVQAARNISRRT